MAVRNFWVEANIDGRATTLAGGPASKEGGMNVTIKQRSGGNITTAARIRCYEENGYLFTEVYGPDGRLYGSVQSER